ncbi:hypothetical protein ACWEQP_34600 [Streptomyces sp. NPDC004044]
MSVGSERSRGAVAVGKPTLAAGALPLRNGIAPLSVVSHVHAAAAISTRGLRAEHVLSIPSKDSRENTQSIENGHGGSGRDHHFLRMFPPGFLRMVVAADAAGLCLSVTIEFPTQKQKDAEK